MTPSPAAATPGAIRLRGLRAANLRNFDLDLPLHRWTAITGPSGAGKSALLGQVLEPVARRRFRILRNPTALPGGEEDWLPTVADAVENLPPVLSLSGELPRRRRHVAVATALGLWPRLIQAWEENGIHECRSCSCRWKPTQLEEFLAISTSWKEGERCEILTEVGGEDRESLMRAGWARARISGKSARLEEGTGPLPADAWLVLDRFRWRLDRMSRLQEALGLGLHRGGGVEFRLGLDVHLLPGRRRCPECNTVAEDPADLAWLDVDDGGQHWILADRTLNAWSQSALGDWQALLRAGTKPVDRRLQQLCATGLGHLAAHRSLGSLSLGEARRLELSSLFAQVRCQQLLWIDEPGLGLHGQERARLCPLLRELVEQGNTLLTADPGNQFLEAADGFVCLGPGGGPRGGHLVSQGERAQWVPPDLVRPQTRSVEFSGALSFVKLELRHIQISQLDLPLGGVVAVVGVSGSGKTTLLQDILLPRLREQGSRGEGFHGVTSLLERALGWSPQSTLATLAGVWSELRIRLADGEEGRIRGLSAADLVASPKNGACPRCRGRGLDEDFMACPVCDGLGLRADLLDLRQGGLSLRSWLQKSLSDLLLHLPGDTRLRRTLVLLESLGLGDRSLGERGRFLSLGERSRLALVRQLASARRGHPRLFLLDEPCLGLPVQDSIRVVEVLRQLTNEGHSFWVVEHEEGLIQAADHVVEIGPGAGAEGGRLLFAGRPEELRNADTPTGRWLRDGESVPHVLADSLPPPALQSEILEEDLYGKGRRRLHEDLLREWNTRSPLQENQAFAWQSGEGETRAVAPVAWPLPAPPTATLLQVLGLDGVLAEKVKRHGEPRCRQCGGAGPWNDLREAISSLQESNQALRVRVWTAPLLTTELSATVLRAAGFRRLWRQGKAVLLRAEEEVLVGDEVWLDRGDALEWPDSTGRLLDMEHHARLLAGGRLLARTDSQVWEYHAGHCRECGWTKNSEDAVVRRWHDWTLDEFRAAPLVESLQHATRATPEPLFVEAASLLAGTSLLERAGNTLMRSLQPLECRLARLLGLLLFPLHGLVLLHDRPLSGLPPACARRLAERLAGPGAHRWTDPEGWSDSPGPLTELGKVAFLPLSPFSLELDGSAWADPAPAPNQATLRQALGLEPPLRRQYLACEEARMRGWADSDLTLSSRGRRCPVCLGRRRQSSHEALFLPCVACGGSGWSRETASLEIRGLRWSDLGFCSLAKLAIHFAESPALAGPLNLAVEAGLGSLLLDAPLSTLALGMASLAPILAKLAGLEPFGECWLHPFAGLTPLEARRVALRMNDCLLPGMRPVCKGHHPALLPIS